MTSQSTNEHIKNCINNTAKVICQTHPGEAIVYDGVIDQDCFDGVAFLLKETTKTGYAAYKEKRIRDYSDEFGVVDYDGGTCDIWDFVTTTKRIIDDPKQRVESVWPILCYWLEAYYKGNDGADFQSFRDKYENEDDKKNKVKGVESKKGYQKDQYDILKNAALVNIKKTAGESTSDDKILNKAVNAYKCLIYKELERIAPKYVVCCGTFEHAKTIFSAKECQTLPCGAECFEHIYESGQRIVFVDFVHPGCRVKKQVTYAYAKDVFNELKGRFKYE